MEEMRQSVRIIKQALKVLPDGDINYFDKKRILPDKDLVYNNMEALIHHFKVIMPGDFHGINPPKGEVYSSTEVPNGELGFHIVSDGKSCPEDWYEYQIKKRLFTRGVGDRAQPFGKLV